MKRIFLTASALFALLQSYSQSNDSGFVSRKLKVEEINLVSSYYSQDGNNAAVTGGVGSQQLTDFANIFDVKLIHYDKKLRKHSFDAEIGIDHYTSASSDKVDLKANSSASHADTRLYPSLTWTIENEMKGHILTAGFSSSTEYDYQSFGGNLGFSKKTKNKNGELTARFQAFLDQVALIKPTELRSSPDDEGYPRTNRNTFAGSLSYSQVINERLQVALLVDLVSQTGYLGLPFYRVYFQNGGVASEKLPDSRIKIPVGIRANYFIGDKIIVRGYYRYYTDDWGLHSHTANIEVPVKLSPFLSVSPFYRYYNQSAVKYFAPYLSHHSQEEYYTSNYDLSKFNSSFFGAGIRLMPPSGVFGLKHFNMLEVRYGHYAKNIGLNANSISLHIKYK